MQITLHLQLCQTNQTKTCLAVKSKIKTNQRQGHKKKEKLQMVLPKMKMVQTAGWQLIPGVMSHRT